MSDNYKLTRLEMESIFLFNEEEKQALIYTHNKRLKQKLEKLERERPNEVSRDHSGDFTVPKSWLKINASKILTDKQKSELSARAKAMREASQPL